MPNPEEFFVGSNCVGYIVRGRPLKLNSEKMLPLEDPIHADCILPYGHIAGYAYEDNSYYEANSLNQRKLKGLEGEIRFNEEMNKHYWNVEYAAKLQVLSTFVLFSVQPFQAKTFENYWNNLREKPPNYNRYLNNCSTLCYEAFVKAGILEEGIFSGLLNLVMTPSRLYQVLIEKYSKSEAKLVTKTGYFGIKSDQKSHGNKIIITK